MDRGTGEQEEHEQRVRLRLYTPACPLTRCDGACASRKAAGRISDGVGAGLRRKREKKVKRDKAPTKWEDMLGQEKGIVISDLGTSFHGIIASTGA